MYVDTQSSIQLISTLNTRAYGISSKVFGIGTASAGLYNCVQANEGIGCEVATLSQTCAYTHSGVLYRTKGIWGGRVVR